MRRVQASPTSAVKFVAKKYNSDSGQVEEVECWTQFEAGLLETLDSIRACLEHMNELTHRKIN